MNGPSDADRLTLLRLAYAAPGSAEAWQRVLEYCARALDAPGATFMFWRGDDCQSKSLASSGLSPELLREYQSYYSTKNPLVHCDARYMRPGLVTLSHMKYPLSEFLRTEYYSDFLRRFDFGCTLNMSLAEHGGTVAHISLLRSLRRGLFTASDAAWARQVTPHLACALQLHQQLGHTHLTACADVAALEQLAVGVIVIGAQRRVLFANAKARRILEARGGLLPTGDSVRPAAVRQIEPFRSAVAAATATRLGKSGDGGNMMWLRRASGRPPLWVLVTPTAPGFAASVKDAVTVLVRDPDESWALTARIGWLYRLTPAEARLAARLLEGDTLRECEEHLGVSHETVRSHMKSIFRKTQTTRQSEFVRCALNGVAAQAETSAAFASAAQPAVDRPGTTASAHSPIMPSRR